MSVIITIFATSYDEMPGEKLPGKRKVYRPPGSDVLGEGHPPHEAKAAGKAKSLQAAGAGRVEGEGHPPHEAKAAAESARIYDIHYLLINLDL